MQDSNDTGPDRQCLFDATATQRGHFTTAQAWGCGYISALQPHRARGFGAQF